MRTDPPARFANALDRAAADWSATMGRTPTDATQVGPRRPALPNRPQPRLQPYSGFEPSVVDRAAARIAGLEGFEAEAYRDVGGVPTIGYGTTGPDIAMGMAPWTEQQGWDRLTDHVRRDSARLADNGYPVTEPFLSASYNLGFGGLRRTGALREARAGNYAAAADSLRSATRVKGRVVPGLVTRRGGEADDVARMGQR